MLIQMENAVTCDDERFIQLITHISNDVLKEGPVKQQSGNYHAMLRKYAIPNPYVRGMTLQFAHYDASPNLYAKSGMVVQFSTNFHQPHGLTYTWWQEFVTRLDAIKKQHVCYVHPWQSCRSHYTVQFGFNKKVGLPKPALDAILAVCKISLCDLCHENGCDVTIGACPSCTAISECFECLTCVVCMMPIVMNGYKCTVCAEGKYHKFCADKMLDWDEEDDGSVVPNFTCAVCRCHSEGPQIPASIYDLNEDDM